MTQPTASEKRRAIKKLEKAIDALVAVQDLGFGDSGIETALGMINSKISNIGD